MNSSNVLCTSAPVPGSLGAPDGFLQHSMVRFCRRLFGINPSKLCRSVGQVSGYMSWVHIRILDWVYMHSCMAYITLSAYLSLVIKNIYMNAYPVQYPYLNSWNIPGHLSDTAQMASCRKLSKLCYRKPSGVPRLCGTGVTVHLVSSSMDIGEGIMLS